MRTGSARPWPLSITRDRAMIAIRPAAASSAHRPQGPSALRRLIQNNSGLAQGPAGALWARLAGAPAPVRTSAGSGQPPVRAADAADRPKPALALPDRPSIAVLPFANLSGDPE